MKNQEGYPDPTAGKAIQNANRMPRHIKEVYDILDKVASLQGLEIVALRDRKTKKVWRKNR